MTKSKLEQYREQSNLKMEKNQKMVERVQKEQTKLDTLRSKFDSTMKKQVEQDKDYTSELDKLSDEIEDQKKLLVRRQQEAEAFSKVRPEKISFDDLLNEINNEVTPAFIEDKINPAVESLLHAKNQFARAVFEFDEAVREHEDIRDDYRFTLGDRYQYKIKRIPMDQKKNELYFLNEAQLYHLYKGELPESWKWNKTLKKGLVEDE